MGKDIDDAKGNEYDLTRFRQRLFNQLDQLRVLLAKPGFGAGKPSLGSELELYIVNKEGNPAHMNERLLELAGDPQLTLELNRYNLEYNLTPQLFATEGLLATEQEMLKKLSALSSCAVGEGVAVVPIGILPTLTMDDLGESCVTPKARYRALVSELGALRKGAFEIDINGRDPLKQSVDNITLEGANTSFQVHQKVAPDDYAASFNAIQLATPLALAISANSPGLFGHRLWDETRIPLFKQSIDTRHLDRYAWHEPPRVCFGHGWVRQGAMELFEQVVRLYPPVVPVCTDNNGAVAPDAAPEFAELRMHLSTAWLWNRPVYDDVAGGHLRVEMRALPAGPTCIDMVAGAAFLMGLAQGLRGDLDARLAALPFVHAEYNFYRAAQHGLSSRLIWPDLNRQGLRETPVIDIIDQLLMTAHAGLAELGVSSGERDRYIGVIERRLAAKRNGADWQRGAVDQLVHRGQSTRQALTTMLALYQELSASNMPIAEWPLPEDRL